MTLCTGIRGMLVDTVKCSGFSPSCSSGSKVCSRGDNASTSSSSVQCHLRRNSACPLVMSWFGRDNHRHRRADGSNSSEKFRVFCEAGSDAGGALSVEEWTRKLPAKKKALYSHSLPCIEAWLQSLGFRQCKEDRAVWQIERPDWHAQLSLDLTDLYVRYLKSGPGNLERDIERKFSYALSREDLENAILGGP
ncbi:hypothetical protein R1flu_005486 [Riccia fluitans]|uniref:Uncharacterized protein n=1 Tax=Riccia fluitans TaxID=41844 RepID=A0ABD1YTB6_9MARC